MKGTVLEFSSDPQFKEGQMPDSKQYPLNPSSGQ